MQIKDLKSILYSSRGQIIKAIIYDLRTGKDIDEGTIEQIYREYGDLYITNIVPSGMFEIVIQIDTFDFDTLELR